MRAGKLYKLAAIYFGVFYLLIVTPWTVDFFNRTDPFILGLPCFQFVILCYILLMLAGLFVLSLVENRMEKNNRPKRGGN